MSSAKNPRNDLIPCTYIGQKGPCPRRCYRGRCYLHKSRESLTLCTKCKVRGTKSKTGICAHGECLWASQWRSRTMKAAADDMDAYVEDLIRTFDATKIDPCPPPCPALGAVSAT